MAGPEVSFIWRPHPTLINRLTYEEGRFDLVIHVTLRPSELRGALDSEVHYEVEIVPHLVVVDNVILVRHIPVLKICSREACRGEGNLGETRQRVHKREYAWKGT